MIADMAGVPLYVVHTSCEQAHEAIRRARQKGMRVYGEPLIQHLVLDETEYFNKDWDHAARRVMSPPFRNKLHQDSLWAGLQAGSLQVVATDHCAFTTKQKRNGVGDFTKIPNGTGGLEDRMPVLWTMGVNTGRLTMNEFVAVTSTNIAKILNMYPKKGAIVEGADADIVVWDPKKKKTIAADKQQSVIDYNVFEGVEVTGLPRFVFTRGEIAVERGQGQARPWRVRRPRTAYGGQPGAVDVEGNHRAAQGRAHRHSGDRGVSWRAHPRPFAGPGGGRSIRRPAAGCVAVALERSSSSALGVKASAARTAMAIRADAKHRDLWQSAASSPAIDSLPGTQLRMFDLFGQREAGTTYLRLFVVTDKAPGWFRRHDGPGLEEMGPLQSCLRRCAAASRDQRIQVRQQDDAFLLVGIGAGDDRGAGLPLRLAGRCGTPAGM